MPRGNITNTKMEIKIRILQNDAYGVLCRATKLAYDDIQRRIINRMTALGILDTENTKHAGQTVSNCFLQNGYTIDQAVKHLFNDCTHLSEVPELLKSIYFWGNAEYMACDDCGSETKDYPGDCVNEFCDNYLGQKLETTVKGAENKRHVITVTWYEEAGTVEKAYLQALQKVRNLNKKHDNTTEIEEIHLNNWGVIGSKKCEIADLKSKHGKN